MCGSFFDVFFIFAAYKWITYHGVLLGDGDFF